MRKRLSVIDCRFWLIFAACWSIEAAALPAGVVSHLSGPLFAQGGNGAMRTLAVDSVVEEGDTLVTEKNTYARLKLKDGAEILLKPASQLRIQRYAYDEQRPEADAAALNLLKGGLRTLTGWIGKRGDRSVYKLEAVTATIGIRGTVFTAEVCQGDCEARPDGLYVEVSEGAVSVGNAAGLSVVVAGQHSYVADRRTPPAPVPADQPPAPFRPPPAVGLPGAAVAPEAAGGSCVVR